MKISQLPDAEAARRDLKALRALQDKTSKAARYDGNLSVVGEPMLLMTHVEVDEVLARREGELMAIFQSLGVEVDE